VVRCNSELEPIVESLELLLISCDKAWAVLGDECQDGSCVVLESQVVLRAVLVDPGHSSLQGREELLGRHALDGALES